MQKISLLFYCLSVFALQNSFAQHPPRFDTEEIQVNPACTSEQMQDISSSSKANFILPCIPVFNAQNKQQRIKTRLVFEGAEFSNMVLNCQGSTLVKGLIIRSRLNETNSKNNSNWSVPRNITIENCKTEGMMHVHGVARNGEGEHLTQSSRLAGHTERTQAQSPSEIHFRYIESNSSRAIPFYFGPGVTESSIKYSNIAGHSGSVAIYFDAETAYNQISHNRISTKTSNRELIAIDGSAHNLITDNHFSSLKNGGIYLYRNCGEGGNIRHQTPQYNLIRENVFEYQSFWIWKPAIWLASRNGNRNYCHLDKGFRLGSSQSDLDFARYNKILDNRFIGRVRIKASDQPNTIEGNRPL